ncbi:DUF5316 domain-containing protein [Evansella sp. LMS18]|jgi:hypothetical protein|uniref:DUF5316 family protein n=1 Tax=Evansella sp. LMS18 TaxID=2924033 RepID=UPI0020D1070D|nr:DUF5316 family protein [Evansella sp. LMS18]UTR12661.1 DUF5316 domain-containing protein [Evansella sp. LMS18]
MLNKAFLFGLIFLAIMGIIALFTTWDIFIAAAGIVAIGSIIGTAIFYGVLLSGDGVRGSYNTETKSDRDKRTGYGNMILVFGLPSLVVTAVYVFLL